MVWPTIISALFFATACSPAQQTVINNADTVLLYQKDTVVTTGASPTIIACTLNAKSPLHYSHDKKTLLILDNTTLITPPDGVYELYVTGQPPAFNTNSSADLPGFVTTLDLYSLTAPGAARQIKTDITEPLRKNLSKKEIKTTAYISICFGPSILVNGKPSTNAGKLHFTGIRIIQTENKRN